MLNTILRRFNVHAFHCGNVRQLLKDVIFPSTTKDLKKRNYLMGANENLCAVLYGVEDMRIEKRDIPEIEDHEVLLAMDCVGICGSDVHFLERGRIGDFVLRQPMIIGHEASGIVAKVGRNVKHLEEGDRCAIEPGVPCYKCDLCKAGKYNLCPDMKFCAAPPHDGNLMQYYKHAADFCYKLPDHVTMEEGALLEPISVAVHACRRAEVGLGSSVLILGSGPIGLTTLLVAQSMGATNILVTDLHQYRLNVAKELGAQHTLVTDPEVSAEDMAKQIEMIMGCKPDKTVDCCGLESTTRLGVFATRSGGVCASVGMAGTEAKFPLSDALCREVDIKGVFRYCNDYPAALALVASQKVNAKRLVTHHFDLKDAGKAFGTKRNPYAKAIKVIIHVQPRDRNNTCASGAFDN